MSSNIRFTPKDYTVAWLCALPQTELAAATQMLDSRHAALQLPVDDDDNSYTYGNINGHNVIIACLPPGQPGKISSQRLIHPLKKSFPNLKLHLFVGIGGGVPRNPEPEDPRNDIRLGDVVVGWAERTGDPAIVQWDFVRNFGNSKVELLGSLDKPHRRLLTALGSILRDRIIGECNFDRHLQRLAHLPMFAHPSIDKDVLYDASYRHVEENTASKHCSNCETSHILQRKKRLSVAPMFHQGTILSGDSVMQDAVLRDSISKTFYNASCFEMEAAGVMDEKNCLVIRGIADYSDSHKNPIWQAYAAGVAAAFARELLFDVQPQRLEPRQDSPEGNHPEPHTFVYAGADGQGDDPSDQQLQISDQNVSSGVLPNNTAAWFGRVSPCTRLEI